ncbi:MAG: hypothetical protein M3081_10855 [Gemmatimonadota bacterium]|nr:hypothetical protein [Gemmatimonadota bacterium]
MTSNEPATLGTRRNYRHVDPARIVETVQRLRARIAERFPDSGLGKVTAELLGLAEHATARSAKMARPHWPIRVGALAASAVMIAIAVGAGLSLHLSAKIEGFPALVQTLESSVNDVVFLGIAIYFLLTIERRMKRHEALKAIHELRSLAHIIDMHQLTKDPEQLLSDAPSTPSSPQRAMTRTELGRYLNYCSELLSLTSKLAVLYAERFDDPIVLDAVSDLEDLSTGLSRKIWQKVMVLGSMPGGVDPDVRRQMSDVKPPTN